MTDLTYKRSQKPQKTEPEEIAVAITAVMLLVGNIIAFWAALA